MKKSLITIPIILAAAGGMLTKKLKKEKKFLTKPKNENEKKDNGDRKNNLQFIDKLGKGRACKRFYKSIKPETKTNTKILNMPVLNLSVNVQLGFFNNEDKKRRK